MTKTELWKMFDRYKYGGIDKNDLMNAVDAYTETLLKQCNVSGWVRLPQEPNIGDTVIVCREAHGSYVQGVYEGKGSIVTSPNCHYGSWEKWLLVELVR